MSVRTELDQLHIAIGALDLDMQRLRDKMVGPRWKFARASLSDAMRKLEACRANVHESHGFVPTSLDTDD